MDELPELRSDEEVDALLARLRAKIAPPAPHASPTSETPATSSHALTDFLAAHGDATATMVRALQVLAEAVDELAAEGPRAQGSGLSSRPRTPSASRRRRGR